MRKATVCLVALIVACLVLSQTGAVLGSPASSTAAISVARATTVYGNYATASDRVTVVNGTVSNLIAYFPSGTSILTVTGQDVGYEYQLSSSPARVVVGLAQPLSAGESTTLKYVYTGFSTGGDGDLGIQPGYSVASVNDTSMVTYGLSNLSMVLQMTYRGRLTNITRGVTYNFTGVTQPGNFTEGTLSQDPFGFQVYLNELKRTVSYSGNGYTVSDSLRVVWSSLGSGQDIYLALPANVVKNSVKAFDSYGNLSFTLQSNRFTNQSLMVVTPRYQLGQGNSYVFQITYRVPGKTVALTSLGFYSTFVQTALIQATGSEPDVQGWSAGYQGYTASFTDLYAGSLPEASFSPKPAPETFATAATVVLVAGFIILVSTAVYTSTTVRKKTSKAAPAPKLFVTLQETLDSLEAAVENTQKYINGSVRINVASGSVSVLVEQERKLVKELGDAVSQKEIAKSSQDALVSSFRQARTALSDLVDLQSQLNQKKIRQNLYTEIRTRYQKNLQSAVSRFKTELNDLRR
ncbi:MAG: hypothetical protein QW767_06830 [Thermoprotei archaeon]